MVGRRGYDALRAKVEFWQEKYSNFVSSSGSKGGCSPERCLGSDL